jgi:aspartyl aminopeptidase
MAFFDSSSDPFHAVHTSAQMLIDCGFEELADDVEPYRGKLQPGGKYFFTRNKSTLVAFAIGQAYQPGIGGFKVIGGHTDSPNLKVKPRSKRSAKAAQSIQIGVECYGGGLWHTWFDRDLGVSGRVLVAAAASKDPHSDSSKKDDSAAAAAPRKIEQHLVKIDRAILRIPSLAIHLQSADDRNAFTYNKEDHLSPILAMAAQKALNTKEENDKTGDDKNSDKEDQVNKNGWAEFQEPLLLQLLASELGIEVEDIVDFELNLFDIQQASLGGVHSEFIHSARLDNLASCFLAVQALVEHVSSEENLLQNDQDISMVVLYDHEEVGSSSA